MATDVDFQGPGWKIVPKYSPKVLVGNWYEERMRTDRGFYDLKFNPYHREIKTNTSWQPDVTIRRKTEVKNNGLPKEHLFNHDDGTKTNQPVKEISGNYGLKEQLQKKWGAQTAGLTRGGLSTTYTVDYTDWPRRSYAYRMPTLGGSAQQTVKSGGHHSPQYTTTNSTTPHRDSLQATGPESGETSRYSRHMVVL